MFNTPCSSSSIAGRIRFQLVFALSAIVLLLTSIPQVKTEATVYDLVLSGGRVIDPATRLDAVRNVGILGGRIAAISKAPLSGKEKIDVPGLVVAPGFIDLHAHGQNNFAQTYQVRDGVTTALELEIGTYPLDALREREGKSIINYGYSAGHTAARIRVKRGDRAKANHEELNESELKEMLGYLTKALDEGALGIGIGLDYVSRGVNAAELESLFKLAASRRVPLFIHIRMPDDRNDLSGLRELLNLTEKTRASFHMVHIVSTGLGRVPTFLKMIEEARKKGLDVTTEAYPYTAGSTGINSGIFDHDWQKKFGISYGEIEWPPTGSRFTGKEMWDEYRARYRDGTIIVHVMKEEWVEQALSHPLVIVASDGMPIGSLTERAHPRGMGCFARVLGRYCREKKILSLGEAIRKMTLMPAERLEKFSPAMRRKGRLTIGADADITVFNADEVIDRATYAEPNQYSKGIVHVIVGGTVVVRNEQLVEGVFVGRPVISDGRGGASGRRSRKK
ncbi:MAG: amidohydrolase family protein [Acidobacteriota bacterium]